MVNLYHVRYFLDAARLGSIAAAARRHRVSHSAVGQAVRTLEDALGVQLTTRARGSFSLSDEGRALLGTCESLLVASDTLLAHGERLRGGYAGPLTVACTHSVAAFVLPETVAQLTRRYPEVQLKMQVGNSQTIRAWLQDGEADIGLFVADGPPPDALQFLPVRKGHYVLFHKRGSTQPCELVVTRRERPEVMYYLERLEGDVSIRCEIISWEAIKIYVAADAGWGICPDYVLQDTQFVHARHAFARPSYTLVAALPTHATRNATLFYELLGPNTMQQAKRACCA